MTREVQVQWRGVVKRFGSTTALDGFDLTAGAGVHAVLGDNGAGKSTALAVLTGARRPSAGTVHIGGRPVRRGSATAGLVGFAPQALSFPPTVRVREVLQYVAAHYPSPRPLDGLVAEVGLGPLERRLCGGLSGGEARRLGIACALVGNAPVVVLDEPSAGLDRAGQRLMRELVRRLAGDGRTVIIASHDLAEIDEVADRIWLVAAGRVASHGSPAEMVAALGRMRIEFDSAPAIGSWPWRAALEAVDPGLVVEDDADRARITTSRPDELSREILQNLPDPCITVSRPGLGEAIDAVLAGEGGVRSPAERGEPT